MNYRILDLKSDVQEYSVNKFNRLLINTNQGVFFDEKLIQKYDEYNVVEFVNDDCFFINNSKIYDLYCCNNEVFNLPRKTYCWDSFDNSKVLFFERKKENSSYRRDFYYYNFKNKKIESNLLFSSLDLILVVNNQFILIDNNSILKKYLINTFQLQWQTDLSQYGEITKIIGVVHDRLWLTTDYDPEDDKGIPKYHLIALDIHTGKVAVNFEHKPYSYFSDIHADFINDKKAIVSLTNTTFYEYDTESLSLVRKLEVHYLKERKIEVDRNIVYGNKIYFLAQTNSIQLYSDILGVLDYHTLEVLWTTEVNTNQYPQVTDDKLYILNDNNELLIFDKTDMEV